MYVFNLYIKKKKKIHLAGKENILADTLSRAHLGDTAEEIPDDNLTAQVHMVYTNAAATEEKMEEIKEETSKDIILANEMK